MAARAMARAGLPPTPHLDLPTSDRPQLVGEDGFEIISYEAAIEKASEAAEEAEEGQAMEVDGEDPAEGAEEAEAEAEEDEAEPPEPLLSIAESMVLSYSLTQTRQHHISHLLPHIFSHPTVPSHSKPRLRTIPKNQFIYPTPPPEPLPLPFSEYHGPSENLTAHVAEGSATPGPSHSSEGKEKGKEKAGKSSKSKQEGDVPAHEMDCIARVNLHIGPMSFSGTELWIGRFVSPRQVPHKRVDIRSKAEKEKEKAEKKAERQRKKQKALSDMLAREKKPASPLIPRSSGSTTATASIARPPATAVRPVRPPSSGSSVVNPQLIQRVNAAAAQNPWLSVIIHKAARSLASKEELSKLARVVARLQRGEGVGEGANDGLTTPITAPAPRPPPVTATATAASPSSTTATPPAVPAPAPGPPTATATATAQGSDVASSSAGPSTLSVPAPSHPRSESSLSEAPSSDLSDASDGEVDMSGPKQVGGGPGEDTFASTELPTQAPVPASAPTSAPAPTIAPPTTAMPGPVSSSSIDAPPTPQPLPSLVSTGSKLDLTSIGGRPPPPAPTHAPSATIPPPAIPPKPIPPPRRYPLPAPFLFVAFKEVQTEKFLIPLGSNSYISRIGGDHVTHPAPPPTPPPEPVIPMPPVEPLEPAKPPEPEAKEISKRTRASLGRHAKDPKEDRPKTPTPVPEPVKEPTPPPPERPKSNLPPLPGMQPAPGTVLISTFVPTSEWLKPDWKALSHRLPFANTEFDFPLPPARSSQAQRPASDMPTTAGDTNGEVKVESADEATKSVPLSPKRSLRPHKPSEPPQPPKVKPDMKPGLLNLSSERFLPESEAVQAVTIRLEGIDDKAWARMKSVMIAVEKAEVELMSKRKPDLVDRQEEKPEVPSSAGQAVIAEIAPSKPIIAVPPKSLSRTDQPRLWSAYDEAKRTNFEKLLKRVPPRSFLQYRLSSVPPELIDASTERFAPRPYPISTKPLYLTSPPPEDQVYELPLPVPTKQKKKRNEVEEEVEFEMPVSFDQLDERVELGVQKPVNRRVGRLKKPKLEKIPSPQDPNKKKHGTRIIEGAICQGCARSDARVWRRGPGGIQTLCNSCADMYKNGTLGPLKAPGAGAPSPSKGGEIQEEGEVGDDSVKMEQDTIADTVNASQGAIQTPAAGAPAESGDSMTQNSAGADGGPVSGPVGESSVVPPSQDVVMSNVNDISANGTNGAPESRPNMDPAGSADIAMAQTTADVPDSSTSQPPAQTIPTAVPQDVRMEGADPTPLPQEDVPGSMMMADAKSASTEAMRVLDTLPVDQPEAAPENRKNDNNSSAVAAMAPDTPKERNLQSSSDEHVPKAQATEGLAPDSMVQTANNGGET